MENQSGSKEKKGFQKRLQEAFSSRWFKFVVAGILSFILLLGAFELGVFIGYRKANFSYQWGENYHLMFGGPQEGFMPMRPEFRGDDFINPHGTTGSLMKADGNTLIIKGGDSVEKTVIVSDKTVIRRGNENVKVSDLKTEDMLVVIGSPDDQGRIKAGLVRIFDAKVMKINQQQ
jgi:hypothetical protein